MANLSFRNINKVYDNAVQAVFDFNLEVKDKEFIVFVGPSGCGKSTTLRMIAGLEEITAGELYIDDKLVNDVEPKDRDIAMVFQSYALYPHMTVFDNMAFALKLKHMSKDKIKKRVEAAAEILGLTPYLYRKPKALSGGQRQRVALGRAIVRSPKVFLMDEPLSNLDAKLRVSMRKEIAKIHEKVGATTIYVTHDQTEAMTLADRIVVMKDGYIQQIGTPKEVYNTPANLFVAGFIGSPAMNVFKGIFDGEKIILSEEGNEKNKVNFSITSEQKNRLKNYAKASFNSVDSEIEETTTAIQEVEAEIQRLGGNNGKRKKKVIKGYQTQLKRLKDELESLNRRKASYQKGVYSIAIGIRPEDVYLSSECSIENKSKPIASKVEICELLGSELIIYGKYAGCDLTAKAKSNNEIEENQELTYYFDMDKLHFFDGESTKRI